VNRPTVEVADIFRAQGSQFIDRHRDRIGFQQVKVMRAILHCRTAALGGHIDVYPRCGGDKFTVSFRAEDSRRITRVGFTRETRSSCPSGFSATCSAESSSMH
jgi:hypothetical protein